jgi:hypothetical protein
MNNLRLICSFSPAFPYGEAKVYDAKLRRFKRLHELKKGYFVITGAGQILAHERIKVPE